MIFESKYDGKVCFPTVFFFQVFTLSPCDFIYLRQIEHPAVQQGRHQLWIGYWQIENLDICCSYHPTSGLEIPVVKASSVSVLTR